MDPKGTIPIRTMAALRPKRMGSPKKSQRASRRLPRKASRLRNLRLRERPGPKDLKLLRKLAILKPLRTAPSVAVRGPEHMEG